MPELTPNSAQDVEDQAKQAAYYAWERAGCPCLPKEDQDRMFFAALNGLQEPSSNAVPAPAASQPLDPAG